MLAGSRMRAVYFEVLLPDHGPFGLADQYGNACHSGLEEASVLAQGKVVAAGPTNTMRLLGSL